jgi:hypothetical protein
MVLFGNCQVKALWHVFNKYLSKEWKCRYICNYKLIADKEKSYPADLFVAGNCDVLVYQPLARDRQPDLCTEDLVAKLPVDTIKLSFPYLFFFGYHPDYVKGDDPKLPYLHDAVTKTCRELSKETECKFETTPELDLVIAELGKIDLFDCFYMDGRMLYSMNEMRAREQHPDSGATSLKIVDFIEAQFRNQLLFYTINHPTLIMIQHIVNQITNILKLPLLVLNSEEDDLLRFDTICPIFDCVTKHHQLQFTFDNQQLRVNRQIYDFRQYVELHVKYWSSLPSSCVVKRTAQ